MKKGLLLFVFTLLPMLAFPEVVEIKGICYNLLPKGSAAEVAGISGGHHDDITIPEIITYNDEIYNVTSIANNAFSGARVNSVTLPNSITYIGESAFNGCSFTAFTMPNSVKSTGIYAFQGCPNLKTITLSNQLTSISGYIFWGCNNLVSIDIPEGVTSIGYHSFASCSSLESVNIPNSVTDISSTAFWGCSKLKSIKLPDNITSIGGYTFRDCTGLISVSIPDKVGSVYGNAFHGCSNLESIVLGSNMNYLDDNAFSSCAKLKDVYCYALTPPSVKEKAFEGSYIEFVVLHVPKAVVDIYKTTEPWSKFKTIVSISETSHVLKYVVDNKDYKSFELYEGESIVPLMEPSKEGYSFSGWNNLPQIMPGQDVTATGSFIINQYKLMYLVDDNEYKTYNIDFGANITPEPNPSKDGYTFSGWSEIPKTMPSHDVSVTGHFTKDPLGKCATPTISYVDGKITFSCETEGVQYHYSIINDDAKDGDGNKIELTNTFTVNVYSYKEDYENSDTATLRITIKKGDLNGDGEVNVADHVELTRIIMNQE